MGFSHGSNPPASLHSILLSLRAAATAIAFMVARRLS